MIDIEGESRFVLRSINDQIPPLRSRRRQEDAHSMSWDLSSVSIEAMSPIEHCEAERASE